MENMITKAIKPQKGQKVARYIRFANTPSDMETSTKPQKVKAAIYCRVASTHSSDAGTINVQRDRLREFAKQQGFGACLEYLDNGYSGNNLNRPAFSKMEADIYAGKIDTVIVRCTDRIARDVFLMENWIADVRAKDVRLIALDGSHEFLPIMFVLSKFGKK
jgi:predicted site-specific integrase-resolvase